eukprot:SAG22_NODE_17336_length_306_cov_10.570048_1_plen_72_part_10
MLVCQVGSERTVLWTLTSAQAHRVGTARSVQTESIGIRVHVLSGGQVTTASLTSTSARASRASTAANALTWL